MNFQSGLVPGSGVETQPRHPAVPASGYRVHGLAGLSAEAAIAEANRCTKCREQAPSCVSTCPVGIDVPRFVAQVAAGNFPAAYETVARDNPLPSVCGRVCHEEEFCGLQCSSKAEPDRVSIAKLERFVGDWFIEHGQSPKITPLPANAARVAVIGSGPAGLTCAAELAKLKYNVTVFEALREAGGRIISGFPEFHLPRKVAKAEIDHIRSLGVTFRLDLAVGQTVTVRDLIERRGYQAVFIAAGAGATFPLDIPGINLNCVYNCADFLNRVDKRGCSLFREDSNRILPSRRVVVTGGGDSAVECARTARRLGADEVTILYRRSLQDLPACRDAVESAQQEGIQFLYQTAPVRLLGDEQRNLRRVECRGMSAGDIDETGRRRPVPEPGTEFQLAAEVFVAAIGRQTGPALLGLVPDLDLNASGRIKVDAETHQTNIARVFAGGSVTRDCSIEAAVGDGKRAASGIHRYLTGIGNDAAG